MKKKFTVVFLAVCSVIMAQIPSDLKFDRNFVESENHWVAAPNKTESVSKFAYGFLYFDETGGGYSVRELNEFTVKDGKFVKTPSTQKAMNIVRLGNPNLKFSFLSEQRINELQVEKVPAFLKNYNIIKDDREKKLVRASVMNGFRRADLALPILQSLKAGNFDSKQLFFELAFANNALKKYSEAEMIVNEAEKKGYLDELLLKEKIYAYSHNNKLEEADKFLRNNLPVFKSTLYKEESIGNMVGNYYRAKNAAKTKEWLDIYYREFPTAGKYRTNMDQLKAELEKTAVKK